MPRSRIIIIVSTAILSVCASVFTFWALTRIEERLNKRFAASIPATDKVAVAVISDVDRDRAPTFSVNPIVYETSLYQDTAATDNQPYATAAAPLPYRNRAVSAESETIPPRYASQNIAAPSGPSVRYIIENAPPTAGLFSLTFDGGSHANAADDILDTLASRGVKSTMFLTGEFIRKYPNVVMKIAQEGHELGNHTNRHPHLTTYTENRTQATLPSVSRQTIVSELNGAASMLADKTGLSFAPLWRAPFGEYNQEICRWAFEAGYVHIGWRQGGSWYQNLDTNDWVPNESVSGYRTPDAVFNKIVNIAAKPGGLNGGIILMHLGTERKTRQQQVHTILGKLIDTLRSMGYEPVAVSELLYRTGIDISALYIN